MLLRAGGDKVEAALNMLDPGLTDKGRRQVEALKKYMAEEGCRFDLVVCSPLARALETCELLFPDTDPRKVVISPLQTETGVDVPGDDRVGWPCRAGRAGE
eukprot:SAG22_NODE_743_length_7504_cov_4.816745_5_plen_101_part_00